jgi:hypothetical protein
MQREGEDACEGRKPGALLKRDLTGLSYRETMFQVLCRGMPDC